MSKPTARVLSDREFVVEHTFEAPASRVFAAYTDPKLVALWWAPKGGSVRIEALDARPGGKYRYVQTTPDGREMVFVGSFLEVKPAQRLVYTFMVEGMGNEITNTIDFQDADGKTHLTMTSLCISKEARDAMVNYGAVAGAKMAWAQLAQVLGST